MKLPLADQCPPSSNKLRRSKMGPLDPRQGGLIAHCGYEIIISDIKLGGRAADRCLRERPGTAQEVYGVWHNAKPEIGLARAFCKGKCERRSPLPETGA